MVLINHTKGVVICENVAEARTLPEKKKGLIGSDGTQGLFLKTRWGIHTFGMKFQIDVAILDKKNIVVRLRKKIKPNRFFFWNPRYEKVIEIPSQLVSSGTLEVGDEMAFIG